jgi:hypothetical protein
MLLPLKKETLLHQPAFISILLLIKSNKFTFDHLHSCVYMEFNLICIVSTFCHHGTKAYSSHGSEHTPKDKKETLPDR